MEHGIARIVHNQSGAEKTNLNGTQLEPKYLVKATGDYDGAIRQVR